MRRIRLVVADRRPIVLDGFASLFAAERDFEVVASCPDGTSCLEAIRNSTPDVVLVEDGFSDVTAAEMLAIAEAEKLSTRFVIYTASVARGEIAAAIAAGACNAISMRAKPETLLKSLRLVAPRPDRRPAGKKENGGTGEDVLAALTDEERKIMRLVAYGMSNKEIARQLNFSPGAIKAHLNLIFQKVQIDNRAELAALVLSRLSGGISALAALIFAALDDVRAAHSHEVDHTPADSFTLMAADDTAKIATIVVTPRKSVGASGTTAKGTIKAGRVDNPGKGTPTPTAKLVDFGGDITSTIQLASPDLGRPSWGSSSAFMMVVAGVLIYELDGLCRSAQAFELDNGLTDFSTSDTANGSRESIAFNTSGSANANFEGFDGLGWPGFGKYDSPFAFDAPRSATITLPGDEIGIVDADAINGTSQDGKDNSLYDSDDHAVNRHETIYTPSATVSASPSHSMDHGGSGETAASDTSQPFEHGASSSSDEHPNRSSQGDLHADEGAANQHAKNDAPGHDPDHGQSQRDLHASERGSAAVEQHAKHDPPGHDPNHAQSQRDSDASEDGAPLTKQHVKNDPPGHDPGHGPSQRDLHASKDGPAAGEPHAKHDPPGHASSHGRAPSDSHVSANGSAAAEQHAKNDPPGHDSSHGPSQRDLHAPEDAPAAEQPAKHHATQENETDQGQPEPDLHAGPANAANNPHSHSSPNAGGKDQPNDGQGERTGAPPLGDSFHFKVMAPNASDDFALHIGHGPASIEHGLHTAGNDSPASIHEADLVSLSVAEQNAFDHGKGAEHHLIHDLLV